MEQVKKHDYTEKVDLRGTAYFVGFLGLFIVLGFIGALALFSSRGLTFLP